MIRVGGSIRFLRLVLVSLGTSLWGCAPQLPEPEIDIVEPVWGYNGEVTPISVRGESFYPSVTVNGGVDNGGRVDAQYQVELVGVNDSRVLTGVTLVDYQNVDALVPEGMAPGLYDLVLTSPQGSGARLEQAFTVTDTRADNLRIDIDGVVHQVNDSVAVELSLRDPDGALVEQDFAVELRLDSEFSASGVVFEDSGLEGSELLEEGVGIRGNLGLDGRSVVVLTSTIPDELELVLSALDSSSIVRSERADLVFEAGEMESVEMLLPTSDFTATAGESFDVVLRVVDAFGNLVEDESARVVLFEDCGGFIDEVTVVGSLTVSLSVTQATNMQCPRNRIRAMSSLEGVSDSFEVLPGPVDHFFGERIDGDSRFVAGEVGPYRIVGQDLFDNEVDLEGVSLVFNDTVGSLSEVQCAYGGFGPYQLCEMIFQGAVEQTQLAVSALGIDNVLGDYQVVANEPAQLLVGSLGSPLVAGALFEMEVTLTDAWGNPVDVDGNQTPFTVSDGGFNTLACTWLGSQVLGEHVLSCTETTASEHIQFSVMVDGLSLEGSSDIVSVVNGALDSVVMIASDQTLIAGESFDLELVGVDAYGNPYTVQTNPNLSLEDSAGGLSTNQAQLSGTGNVALVGIALTKVGDPVVLAVSQAGKLLGELSFQVENAGIDHLNVEPLRSWAWVGQARDVRVSAVDVYDNPVSDFSETLQVSSSQGAFLTGSFSGFSQGVLTAQITWDSAALGDSVVAVSASASGTSALMDALWDDCVAPATAGFEFVATGTDEEVGCLNQGAFSSQVDASTTVPGDAAIATYHVYDGISLSTRSVSTSVAVDVEGPGAYVVELVVADSAACGTYADGVLWAGENDGSVVGPVSVSSSDSNLTAGSGSQGTATISVSAEDCAGDVASNQPLYARVGLGTADPSGTDLSATGEGMVLTLSSTGEGSFEFSVASEEYAGEAVIAVGHISGAAYGEVVIDVEGDNAQPRVAWMDPEGTTTELVDTVEIAFTEGLDSATVSASTVSFTDGAGAAIGATFSLSEDGTRILAELDSVVDTSLDSVFVEIAPDVRDNAGNFLDGDWSSLLGGTSFFGVFGAVVNDGFELVSCGQDVEHFIPDGDDSATLGEADEIGLEVESNVRGDRWLLEVFDADGERIRTEIELANSATHTLLWDGRGDDGILSATGAYELSGAILDSQGNASSACTGTVSLGQAYEKPERVE